MPFHPPTIPFFLSFGFRASPRLGRATRLARCNQGSVILQPRRERKKKVEKFVDSRGKQGCRDEERQRLNRREKEERKRGGERERGFRRRYLF